MRYFFLIVKMIINQFVTPNCISNAEAQRDIGSCQWNPCSCCDC